MTRAAGTARFVSGKIVITVTAAQLRKSQENAPWNYNGEKQCLKVTDPVAFARAVVNEINREHGDDGLTAVHRLLDQASQRAVESACAGVEYDDTEAA